LLDTDRQFHVSVLVQVLPPGLVKAWVGGRVAVFIH
jgi:hypothetical protein